MHPRFVTTKRGNAFIFELVDANDEVLLHSNLFRTKSQCYHEIAEVRSSVQSTFLFEKIKEPSGQFSFVLRNKHREIIGHSRPFWSSSSRDYALMTVRREASDANIEERLPVPGL